MGINRGRFDTRITLRLRTGQTVDAAGNVEQTFTAVEVWAEVSEPAHFVGEIAGAVVVNADLTCRIAWRSDVNEKDRASIGAAKYTITSARVPGRYSHRRVLELELTREGAD